MILSEDYLKKVFLHMLKNAKNSTFLDRFILFYSNGKYRLNTVSEISRNIIEGYCGENFFFFTFRSLTTPRSRSEIVDFFEREVFSGIDTLDKKVSNFLL
jgi:hypothetical protein